MGSLTEVTQPVSDYGSQHWKLAWAQTEQVLFTWVHCTCRRQNVKATLRDDKGEDKEEEEGEMTYHTLLTCDELLADCVSTAGFGKPREMCI